MGIVRSSKPSMSQLASGDHSNIPTVNQNQTENPSISATSPEISMNMDESSAKLQLTSAVIHCGEGLHRGHYIAVCKTADAKYLILDDQEAYPQTWNDMDFYGISLNSNNNSSSSDKINNNLNSNNANNSNSNNNKDLNNRIKNSNSSLNNQNSYRTTGNHTSDNNSNNDIETAYILIYEKLEDD